MWKNIDVEHCKSFIDCQLGQQQGKVSLVKYEIKPAVTISRMTGSGGHTVASKLAEYLQARVPAPGQWTVFDRNLIEEVMKEHHLDKHIAEFMSESHKPVLTDMLEELFGLHPSSWTLVQKTSETVLRLAQLGYVILMGRGANIITQKLSSAFHVRLIGSLEQRLERVRSIHDLSRQNALKFLKQEDKRRRQYLKEHFQTDIADPSLYHLVINTDRIPYDEAARLIGEAVVTRFHLDRGAEALVSPRRDKTIDSTKKVKGLSCAT